MHTNYTNNTNRKIFSIILLAGFTLFNLFSINYADAVSYPYESSNNNCTLGSGDFAVSPADDNPTRVWCVQIGSKPSTTGQCTDPTTHQIKIPTKSTLFYCLPNAGVVEAGGVSNLTCPASSVKSYDAAGNMLCDQYMDAAACPDISNRLPLPTGGYVTSTGQVLCRITPTSITGANGTTIASPCDSGYKQGTNGSKTGACKEGDYMANCGTKGFLCVAPAIAGGEKITQTVRPYITKYTLPCQKLAGGQCPSDNTPAGYIARLYQFGLMIVGLFAFGGIIYGALKYILSAGNMADQSNAKEQITQAVLGLLLLLGAFLILYTINPAITNLKNPQLEVIDIKKIIKAGEAVQPGGTPNQIATGGGESGDQLCKTAVNAQINLNINADTTGYQNSFLGGLTGATDPPALPNGTQSTGYMCISCKDNASKGSNGTCACNAGYTQDNGECVDLNSLSSKCGIGTFKFNNTCISEADCLAKPGYSAVAGAGQYSIGTCIKK